jgi:membrane protein required for colicin V production
VSLAGVGWVDWTLLSMLCVSTVIGLVRGLLYEVMSLFGWVVAYVVAQMWSTSVAPLLPIGSPGSGLNAAAAFMAVFLAVLLAWGLLSWLVRKLVQSSPLNILDRALGGIFGLMRGLLFALAIATAVGMTPLSGAPAWRSSHSVVLLDPLLAGLRPLLPESIRRHLHVPNADAQSGA